MPVPCVVVTLLDAINIIVVGTDSQVESCHGVATLMVFDGENVVCAVRGVAIDGVVPSVCALTSEMVIVGVRTFAYVDVDGVNAVAACGEVDGVKMETRGCDGVSAPRETIAYRGVVVDAVGHEATTLDYCVGVFVGVYYNVDAERAVAAFRVGEVVEEGVAARYEFKTIPILIDSGVVPCVFAASGDGVLVGGVGRVVM